MSIDRKILGSWSILRDYNRNKDIFLAVGRAVYRTLQDLGEITPQDMEPFLISALLVTKAFKDICASKRHASVLLYPIFAESLARYILEYEWDSITFGL